MWDRLVRFYRWFMGGWRNPQHTGRQSFYRRSNLHGRHR